MSRDGLVVEETLRQPGQQNPNRKVKSTEEERKSRSKEKPAGAELCKLMLSLASKFDMTG